MIDVLDVTNTEPGVGYVYRWVNLVNGKMYIGSHCGSRASYTASGVAIRAAFKNYGMENFRRELLYIGPEYKEMEVHFLELVDAMRDRNYYNLKNTSEGFPAGPDHPYSGVTGEGHPTYGRGGDLHPMYGKYHTDEAKEKNRQAHLGMTHNEETRIKMSESHKKRIAEHGMPPLTEATKGKLSIALRAHFEQVDHPMKGKSHTQSTCPHCGKTGGINVMPRWHFDNCKQKKKE